MTNLQRIRTSDVLTLAKFLHRMQALAILSGADSEESLVCWLAEEEDTDDEEENNDD